jgi:hypothetical protein
MRSASPGSYQRGVDMTLAKSPARGSAGKRELCLTLAETAAVSTTFDVWPDISRYPDGRVSTDSFSEALGLMTPRYAGSIRIRFDWRVGRRGGRSEIEYSNVPHPLATMRYVRQLVRNRIKKEIAVELFKEDFNGYYR